MTKLDVHTANALTVLDNMGASHLVIDVGTRSFGDVDVPGSGLYAALGEAFAVMIPHVTVEHALNADLRGVDVYAGTCSGEPCGRISHDVVVSLVRRTVAAVIAEARREARAGEAA